MAWRANIKSMIFSLVIVLILVLNIWHCGKDQPERPNIVLILVDDMGFSDLGCYGSEISTSNIDVMTTFCDIADVNYAVTYNNHQITPTVGKSLIPIFSGQVRKEHKILCWEHIGSVGIRKGNWKLIAKFVFPSPLRRGD